jgi:hypothetical protein
MDAVTYPDAEVQNRLARYFVCSRQPIESQVELARRFAVPWTPGLLFMDPDEGVFYRGYGFYPPREFAPMLTVAYGLHELGRRNFQGAIDLFQEAVPSSKGTPFEPEVLYWLGVAHYKAGDKDKLASTWNALLEQHPQSLWSKKAGVIRAA